MSTSNLRFVELRAIISSYCRPPVDIENLAATIWFEEWERGAKLPAWLIRCRCFDELRKLKTEREHEYSYSSNCIGLRLHSLWTSELESLVSEALDVTRISPSSRFTLYQRFYLGLSIEEISKGQNRSSEEVTRDLRETLKGLKEKL